MEKEIAVTNNELLNDVLNILRRLLDTDYAEDCQECGIGQKRAWRDAKKLIKRIDETERTGETPN